MERSQKKFNIHIHSKYSFDSLMEPSKIVKIAKKKGIEVISITDHDNMRAYRRRDWINEADIEIIPGMEIKTNVGDILALNIEEEIRSREFNEVIGEIRSQGGISVLPHPFRGHRNILEIVNRVDAIEVWNGHCTQEQNMRALELSLKLKKPHIVGSDAHLYSEIGNAIIIGPSLLDPTNIFDVKYPSETEKQLSNIIGHFKKGRIWNMPISLMRLVKAYWK